MTTLNIYAAGSLRLALPAVGELFKQFHPINLNCLGKYTSSSNFR